MGNSGVNRRDFLKTITIGGGSIGLVGGLTKFGMSETTGLGWDEEADVVIAGFGGAGGAAAVEASDAGCSVLILEKAPGWGGSTAMAMGVYATPKSSRDIDAAADYIVSCANGMVEKKMALIWANEAINLTPWFEKLGGSMGIALPLAYHPSFYGCGALVGQHCKRGAGVGLHRLLVNNLLQKNNVKYLLETPVNELITNNNGEVIGVLAEDLVSKKILRVKARKGVVLACGGFDHNNFMKNNYFRFRKPVDSLCALGNTGDAITMAGKLGAKMVKLSGFLLGVGHKPPGYDQPWLSLLQISSEYLRMAMVIVNKQGKRFVNETLSYDTVGIAMMDNFDPAANEYKNLPAYCIFDETTRKSVACGWGRGWSSDNSKEIEKGGF